MSARDNSFNWKDSVTLKEYIESKIESLDKKIEMNLHLNQIALDKAAAQMDERLSRMNEFRDTLRDQAGTFITRTEIELITSKIDVDIRELRESRAKLEGKADQNSVYVAYVFAIIAVIISLIKLFG